MAYLFFVVIGNILEQNINGNYQNDTQVFKNRLKVS